MKCVGCGSAAVPELSDRTAQVYRRFQCCAFGRGFNECNSGMPDKAQSPSNLIALVVLWRLHYPVLARLIRLDVGGADKGRPLGQLCADPGAEMIGRALRGIAANLGHAGAHLRPA